MSAKLMVCIVSCIICHAISNICTKYNEKQYSCISMVRKQKINKNLVEFVSEKETVCDLACMDISFSFFSLLFLF